MSLKIFCSRCDRELEKPGALIISPPNESYSTPFMYVVSKYHLCLICFDEAERWLLKLSPPGAAKPKPKKPKL